MDSLMSFSGLSHALGARLFPWEGKQGLPSAGGEPRPGPAAGFGFSSVCIDSRAVVPGSLFVALRGEKQDGHSFVDAAFKAGASGAMVSLAALENPAFLLTKAAQKWKGVLIAVEDTLKGLQDAARVYLGQFSNLIRIGITGSTGKTTTKEIAAAIIGQEKSIIMNEGNLNSETGLPLSVFNVNSSHEVGVFEAGMNREGEISELAKVLNPHLALITNIGSAHIGILGSRGKIAEEKKKIFSEFSGNNTALIPMEDEYRDFLAGGICGKAVFYGQSSLPALGGIRDLGLSGTEILWDGKPVRFALPGKFNLDNAIAAIALSLELPVSSASICRGLESVKPLFGRNEIFYGRATLIRDCYNSSPEGAEAALDFCDSLLWPGRKIYVLGSMLEQGGFSDDAHAALGRRLSSSRGDMVFLYGKEMLFAEEVLRKSREKERGISPPSVPCSLFTCDMGELSLALDNYIKKGDLVLIKGSRGCALEKLTDILLGEKLNAS